MSDLDEITNEFMQDPEFRKEYEALQPERDLTLATVNTGNEGREAADVKSRRFGT